MSTWFPILAAVSLAITDLPAKVPIFWPDILPRGVIARIGDVRLKHGGNVNRLAFSPDGKTLATTGEDCILRVWDVATGREIRRLDNSADMLAYLVDHVTWSPDGKTIALSIQQTGIRLLDSETFKERQSFAVDPDGRKGLGPALAFAPDSQTVVWCDFDGVVRLYDVVANKEIGKWPGFAGGEPRFAFSRDGKKLAIVSGLVTTVVDPGSGKQLARYKDEQFRPYSLTFSPDGKTLALGGESDVRLCDLAAAGDNARAIGSHHKSPIQWLRYTADGRTLYSSGRDGEVKVWDVAARKERRSFTLMVPEKGTANSVSEMAYSPDGTTLAWAAWSNRIRFTKLATGEELLPELENFQSGPFVFTRDAKHIVTPGTDGKLRQWDAASGKLVRRFEGQAESVYFLGVSSDGKRFVTVGQCVVVVWDAETGKECKRLEITRIGNRSTVALSPDGKTLALGQARLSLGTTPHDCRIYWLDLETGKELAQSASVHKGSIVGLTFAPSGATMASSGADNTTRVWEVSTGKQLANVQVPVLGQHLGRLAYTADGTALLVTHIFSRGANIVRVTERDPDTVKERKMRDFDAASFGSFTPDGSRIALKAQQRTVRVFDVASQSMLVELKGDQGAISHVAFSADGKKLATGGADGTILIWDLARTRKP